MQEELSKGGRKGLSNGPKPSGTCRHFVVQLDEKLNFVCRFAIRQSHLEQNGKGSSLHRTFTQVPIYYWNIYTFNFHTIHSLALKTKRDAKELFSYVSTAI